MESALRWAKSRDPNRESLRGRHWGGGKKRGVENLTNDTPPKKGFWTPPRTVRFPPPSGVSALFFLYKNPRQSRPKALLEGSKIFSGERVLWYVFLPPYVLHPPHITAQIASDLKTRDSIMVLRIRSTPNMTGQPGCRTMEMIGGSSVSYLACTPCVPLLSASFT